MIIGIILSFKMSFISYHTHSIKSLARVCPFHKEAQNQRSEEITQSKRDIAHVRPDDDVSKCTVCPALVRDAPLP